MNCCDPDVYDDRFDARSAELQLREYQRNGPDDWTTRLIDELAEGGVDGMTVLDIGAGVGAVHHALLVAGARSAVDVDASGPYLAAARGEAERRGLGERVTYRKGDAVALAPELDDADLGADRVVCCYGDMAGLERGGRSDAAPAATTWVRAMVAIANGWNRLRRDPFRIHAHCTADVARVATASGLVQTSGHRGLFWQSMVFERAGG